MTLPTSGPITIGMVATELGISLPLSLGYTRVRALAGIPSGPISLGNLRGKTAGGGGGGGGAPSTLAASMADAEGSAISGSSSAYVTTVPISISVSGGQSPYSYAWSKLSGTGFITAANSPSTVGQFNVPAHAQAGLSYSEVAQCIVTDAVGATVTCSANVTLTID